MQARQRMNAMSNRICEVQVEIVLLTPAKSELLVRVVVEGRTPTAELRGRLTGPHCAFANTVQVAYPLQPVAGPALGEIALAARVVIPESSFWDPASPFLYRGTI